jgi:hypothetical protein
VSYFSFVFDSLVDVEACYTSPFELLGDPITSNGTAIANNDDIILYTRAYRVDDNGRNMLIELARSHGSCGTCSGSSQSESTPIIAQGFRAEISGTVAALSSGSDDGYVPVLVEVTDAKRSNNQATVCGMTIVTSAPAPTTAPSIESDTSQQSNNAGITALSAIVVLMASALAIISLYSGVVGSTNARKSSIQ